MCLLLGLCYQLYHYRVYQSEPDKSVIGLISFARQRRRLLRCRANMARLRQSRPDSGRGLQPKSSMPFRLFPLRLEAEGDLSPGFVRNPTRFLRPTEVVSIGVTTQVLVGCPMRVGGRREDTAVSERDGFRGGWRAVAVVLVGSSCDSCCAGPCTRTPPSSVSSSCPVPSTARDFHENSQRRDACMHAREQKSERERLCEPKWHHQWDPFETVLSDPWRSSTLNPKT